VPAAAAEPPVIPILPESTLKFGEPREPYDDTGAALDARAPTAPAATYVIVAPTPEQPTVFGRYRLIERLSEGGMSELFIARATGVAGFSRAFVLKRLRPALARDKNAVAQFIDEARLQAGLVHSNIVPVFDFGVVDGEYFMTQEHIVGRDLGRLVERHRGRAPGGLPTPIAYYAAHETLQALAYAHARCGQDGAPLGIVHRDVAAGNVIVSLAGEVKLADFGIVTSNDRINRTQDGMVKGNVNFMSPEQARGQTVDGRSDLFSLGLVLYYCLAGELLYAGSNDLEVLHHAAAGAAREDFARIRRLPDPAPQILERALAFDPNQRFQSAGEFADALAIHMGGGRNGAATLMRELFAQELLRTQTALPAAPAVGYTAGP
jgi:serine/threonine-protein kinase